MKYPVQNGIYNTRSLFDLKSILMYSMIIFPFPSTIKARIFKFSGVNFKNFKKVFIGYNVWLDTAYPSYIHIGEHVIIGAGTKIICHSTGTYLQKDIIESKVEKVVIEDGVLIGINCTILNNVTIGKCAVVSAGSVVTKNVAPYTVVTGNPAIEIKKLNNEL